MTNGIRNYNMVLRYDQLMSLGCHSGGDEIILGINPNGDKTYLVDMSMSDEQYSRLPQRTRAILESCNRP